MKHGQHPEITVRCRDARVHEVAHDVQRRVAVRDHDAFRVRRGAAGVVESDHFGLSDCCGCKFGRGGGQGGFVVDPAGLAAAEGDEVLHAGHLIADLVHGIEVVGMHAHDAGTTMVEDVGEIVSRKAEIDRHDDGPDLWHGVIGFKVRVRVWSDAGDAVTGFDGEFLQRRRPSVAPVEKLAVGEAVFAIYHGLAVSVKPAGTAGEIEWREWSFHGQAAIIDKFGATWR